MQLENPNTLSSPLSNHFSGSGQYGQIRRIKRAETTILLIGYNQPHLVKEATRLGWLSSSLNACIRFSTPEDIANVSAKPFDWVLCEAGLVDCATLIRHAKQGLISC